MAGESRMDGRRREATAAAAADYPQASEVSRVRALLSLHSLLPSTPDARKPAARVAGSPAAPVPCLATVPVVRQLSHKRYEASWSKVPEDH